MVPSSHPDQCASVCVLLSIGPFLSTALAQVTSDLYLESVGLCSLDTS